MFIPPIFPFITRIDDEGDNGGGDNETVDPLGVPDNVFEDNQQEQQQQDNEVKLNPAWNKVLEPLPQEFHKQIMPHLQEWDTNFAKVQSEYAPYKPLIENKVPYEQIQKAFQFAALVNSNPRAVYDQLGQRFGFNSGQGQQQVDEDEDDEQQQQTVDASGQPFDITKHPQFVELQNVVNQLQQGITQQQSAYQQQQEETRIQGEINNEFQALEQKIQMKLPEDVKTEVIRRAIMIGDARGDGNYWIEEGYRDYANFVNKVRNSRANNTAPDVLSGNGGVPSSRKSQSQMTEDERVEYYAKRAQQIAEGNQ